MKFKMVKHHSFPMAPHADNKGNIWSQEGSVIEAEHNLVKMFPGKFEKAPANAKVTDPDPKRDPMSFDDDDGFDLSKGNPNNLVSPKVARLAEAQAEGDEEAEEYLDKEIKKDDKKAAKSKPKDSEQEDDADEDEPEVVTDKFKAAGENDLTVHHGKDGFVVMDGKKTLTKEPLKTKAKVNSWLNNYTDNDDE